MEFVPVHSPDERDCGVCGRRLDPRIDPAWVAVELDGRWVWQCPDCTRAQPVTQKI